MKFEWDLQKAANNQRKHRVSFVESATVFNDPLGITVFDPDHSVEEDRHIIVGISNRHRLLIVAFAECDKRIRIISARLLSRTERKAYEEEYWE